MSENMEFFVEQGLTEEETDELLSTLSEEEVGNISGVSGIFSSYEELAQYYLDNVVGTLDSKVEDAIDMEKLGKNVASDDEYFAFESGRIAEFDM